MLRAEVYVRALRASQKREESRGVGGRAMRLMRGRGVWANAGVEGTRMG